MPRCATAGRVCLALNSERHVKPPQQIAQLSLTCQKPWQYAMELSSRLEFTLEALGMNFPKYPVRKATP